MRKHFMEVILHIFCFSNTCLLVSIHTHTHTHKHAHKSLTFSVWIIAALFPPSTSLEGRQQIQLKLKKTRTKW
uniref:Putative secreted peptide n=1 Tax=Anopheles braziliensis TaxID=58242 RepID=A0A2M3ZMZ9_9DIPT